MAEWQDDRIKPEILGAEVIAQSRFFKVEQVQLRFSNGEERLFERMRGSGRGAVMVVACPDPDHFYLIREYCAGTHDYQLGFPKGLIDPGEDALQAGDRELKEEAGFGARQIIPLRSVALAPGYFNATMQISTEDPNYSLLADQITTILSTHPLLISAALPQHVLSPLLNSLS